MALCSILVATFKTIAAFDNSVVCVCLSSPKEVLVVVERQASVGKEHCGDDDLKWHFNYSQVYYQ